MKKVENIEIKNFKSIRHQKIEDCRRINVFIGYPNAGKSNILEALGLFSIDNANADFSSFIRIQNLTTLFHNGEINEKVEVRINEKHRFVGKFLTEYILFEEQFERQGTSFANVDNGNIFFDDSTDVTVTTNFLLFGDQKKISEYKKGLLRNEDALSRFKKYEFLKHVSFSNNKAYFDLACPYGDNIFNIISTNSSLRKEIEELFLPNSLELLFDSREQKFTILKRTSTGIFSIPYELVADTLQRLIFYKAAIASNKESVLLFEEPEAHLFPPYVKKLTSDIIFDQNNNQFFITTHSPYVLTEFIEEIQKELAVYIIDYDKGETVIKRLDDNEVLEIAQYGIDLFFNLESYLDKYGQPHST